MMTPREYFTSKGLLKPASNKYLQWRLFKLFFIASWADTWCWSSLTEQGFLHDKVVGIDVVRSTAGDTAVSFYLFKLNVMVTIL